MTPHDPLYRLGMWSFGECSLGYFDSASIHRLNRGRPTNSVGIFLGKATFNDPPFLAVKLLGAAYGLRVSCACRLWLNRARILGGSRAERSIERPCQRSARTLVWIIDVHGGLMGSC